MTRTTSLTISPRGARRLYLALCCVCARPGGDGPRRVEALREIGARLGLRPATLRRLEASAPATRTLPIGRPLEERRLLALALAALERGGGPLEGQARGFAERLRLAAISGSPSPASLGGPAAPPSQAELDWSREGAPLQGSRLALDDSASDLAPLPCRRAG